MSHSCLKIFCPCCIKDEEYANLIDNAEEEEIKVNHQEEILNDFQKCRLKIDDLSQVYFVFNEEVYFRKELIGQGGFSKVFKVHFKKKDQMLVLKQLTSKNNIEEFIKEYEVLKVINHPFIIKFYGCLIIEDNFCFLMEYADKGTLEEFLQNPFIHELDSPLKLIDMAESIVMGVQYLQMNKIVHRDLKPDNILLTSNFQAKIGDLGLAKLIVTNQKLTKKGNLLYAAPEKITEDDQVHYGLPSDIYSLGLILCELFLKLTSNEVFKMQTQLKDSILSGTPQDLKKLLQAVTASNPFDRPNCQVILDELQSFKQNDEVLKFLGNKYLINHEEKTKETTSDQNDITNKMENNKNIFINNEGNYQQTTQDSKQNKQIDNKNNIAINQNVSNIQATNDKNNLNNLYLIQNITLNKEVNNEQTTKDKNYLNKQGKDHNQDANQQQQIQLQNVKLLIVGEQSVGKTTIIHRWISGNFIKEYIPTIGVDCQTKRIQIQNKSVKLLMWDCSGLKIFQPGTQNYYRGSHIVLIVYSINDFQSFESVNRFVNETRDRCDDAVKIIIIGNKCDLEEREVSFQQGLDLAQSCGADGFFETSAKENIQINETLLFIKNSIIPLELKKSSISIQKENIQQKKPVSRCCGF